MPVVLDENRSHKENFDFISDVEENSFGSTKTSSIIKTETDLWSTSHLVRRIEKLKEKLNIKLSALNALKLNETLNENSKVFINADV